MANKVQLHMKSVDQDHLFLDDLQPGSGGPLKVMINRRWDVYTAKGKYLTTDFIISDEKGNLMHGTSTHNKAFKFLEMVKEGFVYLVSGFKVQANRKDFQLIEDSPYILEFNGSTTAKKAVGDLNSFVRYRFQITPFEALVPVDNKYLVDVVGYALYLGEPKTKSTGAKTVEFLLTNESHVVGLSGRGYDKEARARFSSILLHSYSNECQKIFGELGISSTSSTQIIESPDVPALNSFISAISNHDLSQIPLQKLDTIFSLDTLADLMQWGLEWKNGMHSDDGPVVFKHAVQIVDIRTRNGWYLITCSTGRCRKGLTRVKTGFKCEGCGYAVLYPHIRPKRTILQTKHSTITITIEEHKASEKDGINDKSFALHDTSSEDEQDIIPLGCKKTIVKQTTPFDTPLKFEDKRSNEKGKGLMHMQDVVTNEDISDDAQDNMPIRFMLKKQEKKINTEIDGTQQSSSSPDQPQQSHNQTNNAPSQYLFTTRKFKARKMEPGEEGESESNPIILI